MKIKKENMSGLVPSIVSILIGIFALVTADRALQLICICAGAVLAIYGLIHVIVYFSMGAAERVISNAFMVGGVFLALGIAVIAKADVLAAIIPFALGLFITVLGIKELQNALDALKLKWNNSWIPFVLSLVLIGFGVFAMINPIGSVATIMKLIGIGLVVSGLVEVITYVVVVSKANKDIIDSTAVIIEDEK